MGAASAAQCLTTTLVYLIAFAIAVKVALVVAAARPCSDGNENICQASSFDESGPTPAHGGRGGRAQVPLDKEHAFKLVFCEKTLADVWRRLERLIIPLRDREDVRQEVFESAFASWHAYDPTIAPPWGWLNKIVIYTAAKYWSRSYLKHEELTPDDPQSETPAPSPSAYKIIEAEQDWLNLLHVLQSLDEKSRSVFVAHDIDEIPMKEIASNFGIPITTAYKRRTRAIETIRLRAAEQRDQEQKSFADLSGASSKT